MFENIRENFKIGIMNFELRLSSENSSIRLFFFFLGNGILKNYFWDLNLEKMRME